LEKDSYSFLESRLNPYQKEMQHLKTLDVYEIIEDCDVIISSKIGKKGVGRLEERGIELYFFNGNIFEGIIKFKEDKCLN
jgi:predicted Fe-Mo cluster-binding NifX family protein